MCRKILSLLLLSVLSWASWGQPGPSSLLDNLEALGGLLDSIERTNSEQQRQLTALNEQLESSETELQNSNSQILLSGQAIADLKSISETQGEYLRNLQFQLQQKQMISEAQLRYTKGLQIKSKVLTVSLAVGIPAVAALGGWLGWTLAGK